MRAAARTAAAEGKQAKRGATTFGVSAEDAAKRQKQFHKENHSQSPLHPHATRSRGVLQSFAATPANSQENQLLMDFSDMNTG